MKRNRNSWKKIIQNDGGRRIFDQESNILVHTCCAAIVGASKFFGKKDAFQNSLLYDKKLKQVKYFFVVAPKGENTTSAEEGVKRGRRDYDAVNRRQKRNVDHRG